MSARIETPAVETEEMAGRPAATPPRSRPTPTAPLAPPVPVVVVRERSIWPLILWVTLPYWAVMTITRVLSYAVRVAAVPGVTVADPTARIVQHGMLFVFLVLFYRLAFS